MKLQIMKMKFEKYKVVWNANLKRVNIFYPNTLYFYIINDIFFSNFGARNSSQ